MKKFALLSLCAALLLGLFCGCGIKKIDNEYLYTLEGTWEGARDFSEGLAAVKKDGKWGYINTDGEMVIDPIYDSANSFSEGLAAVQSKGRWGYINTKGETVIAFTMDSTFAFSDGMAVFASGIYYGYINREGKVVIKATYEEAGNFHNGIACVKEGVRYGFIDKEGNKLTEFEYGLKSKLSEGLIPVFYGDTSKGINTGYIDATGKQVLEFRWYEAKDFSNGLAAAKDEYTKPWGYINQSGEYVIAPQWDFAEDFSFGFALVQKDRKYFYIDTTGAPLSTGDYTKAYSFTEEGLARVGITSGMGYKFGYIGTDGNEIVAPKYENATDFHHGYAAVFNGKKWGFINAQGVEISKFYWTEVGEFTEDGIAMVQNGEKYGFIKLK